MKENPQIIINVEKENTSWKDAVKLKLSQTLDDLDNAKEGEKVKISATTLHELRLLLELCEIPPNEITMIIAHENAHANKTDSLGIKGLKHKSYKITLEKDGEDYIITDPETTISIPFKYHFLRKKRKELLKQILMAPIEYGEELSKNDIEKLKKL